MVMEFTKTAIANDSYRQRYECVCRRFFMFKLLIPVSLVKTNRDDISGTAYFTDNLNDKSH